MNDFYISDEKKMIHLDGWMFFIRDSGEGMVDIGYKEFSYEDKDYVTRGEPMHVSIDYLPKLVEMMNYFIDRGDPNEN